MYLTIVKNKSHCSETTKEALFHGMISAASWPEKHCFVTRKAL